MEKKIRKRVPLYGIAAALLAIVLGTICYFGAYLPAESPEQPWPTGGLLNTFSSYEELRSFLKANQETQGSFPFFGPADTRFLGESLKDVPAESASGLEFEYSTTNIQVAGVDEADIVKTDGEHIYVISGNSVFILKAYPTDGAEILSNITFQDMYPVGIFASHDRLAVLGCKYTNPLEGFYNYYYVDVKTSLNVYDVSDKANPTFLTDFAISGSYFNSRMIGEYVYFVTSQPTYIIHDTVILPKIYSKNGIREITPSEIHYSGASDNYYLFTTVVALNMQNIEEEPNRMTIMLGGTSSMYVSLTNMYITFRESSEQTSIYRVHIENSTMSCEAKGKVPGRELNQFSMDEYNSYFRIATTTWINGDSQNSLYILDMNLTEVGKIENIAPGEAIDSARFIGNRCYLATSIVRKDPFFVIDVENATEPKILGYLKIPGFSRYLHPYDEDHVIGIGKDENNRVKISVFDVTNVSAPTSMTEYKVEGVWSDTLVLTEHKAFLFDKTKDLLAISVTAYDHYPYSQWQGAYVFNITLSDGLDLRRRITHQEDGVDGWNSSYWVKRTLYIEDVLYTVSDKKIKMNNLEDLTFLKEIRLP